MSHRRAAVRLAPVLLVLVVLALSAAPAFSDIRDEDAPPSLKGVVAHPGADWGGDVLIAGGAVWLAGSVSDGAGGTDSSLTRVVIDQAGVGGADYTQTIYTTGVTSARHMAAGKDGVMYSAGYQKTAAGYDFCVIKWSKMGTPVWKRSYNGAGKGFDVVTDVAADRWGNVVVCGESRGAGSADWAVVSWTPSGQRRWVWGYDGAAHQDDLPRELVVDGSGSTYVAGRVNAVAGIDSAFTVKLSPAGKKLWSRRYSGRDGLGARARCLTPVPGGGVIVAGDWTRTGGGHEDLVVRYSSAGKAVLFQSGLFWNQTETAGVNDVVVTTEGVVVGVGWWADGGPTWPREWGWSLDGSPAYSTADPDAPYSDQSLYVARDSFGGRCVAGTAATAEGQTRVTTSRTHLTSVGFLRWYYATDFSTPGAHTPSGIVCWKNVVATGGTVDRGGGDYDQFVMVWKY